MFPKGKFNIWLIQLFFHSCELMQIIPIHIIPIHIIYICIEMKRIDLRINECETQKYPSNRPI